jgi:hypothetical protein
MKSKTAAPLRERRHGPAVLTRAMQIAVVETASLLATNSPANHRGRVFLQPR